MLRKFTILTSLLLAAIFLNANPSIGEIMPVQDMIAFRSGSTPEMNEYFQGVILTSWSSAEGFMKNYYDTTREDGAKEMLSIFEVLP